MLKLPLQCEMRRLSRSIRTGSKVRLRPLHLQVAIRFLSWLCLIFMAERRNLHMYMSLYARRYRSVIRRHAHVYVAAVSRRKRNMLARIFSARQTATTLLVMALFCLAQPAG